MTTYTIYQDGGHYSELDDLDQAIGLVEVLLGGTSEDTTFTVEDDCGEVVASITNRRIIGQFVKQAWGGRKGDDAIFVEEVEFDATSAVLNMPFNEFNALEDNDITSDVVGKSLVDWKGPFEVKLVDQVCAYFGVEEIGQITPTQLFYARTRSCPQIEKVVTLTIRVKVKLPKLESEDETNDLLSSFADDLDYEVRSNTVGVEVVSTEITES